MNSRMKSLTWFQRHQGAMQGFGAGKVHGVALAVWEEQIVVGEQGGEETRKVAPRTVLEKDSKA